METQEIQSGFETERSYETRETRELELNPEAQAAAALERAEIIVKEVKSNKKQMQNIVMHMGQVQAAIAALRAQLEITSDSNDTSVSQDAATIERLKAKISGYTNELLAMEDDLYNAALLELAETDPDMPMPERETVAKARVEGMLQLIEE